METINNIANAASKAVFGEGAKPEPSSEEPKSGETGAGTPDSPYDKGNLEPVPLSVVIDMEESTPLISTTDTDLRPSVESYTPEIRGISGPRPEAPSPFRLSIGSGKGKERDTTPGTSEAAEQGYAERNPSTSETTSSQSETEKRFRLWELRRYLDKNHARNIPASAKKKSTTDGSSDKPAAVAGTAFTPSTDSSSAPQPKETSSTQGSNIPTSEPNAEETSAIQAKKKAAEAILLNKGKGPATEDGPSDANDAPPAGAESGKVDAAKPDAVKDAKAAATSATTDPTPSAKNTSSKDSEKGKGSMRERMSKIKGKLPFGKKKSGEGSTT